MLILLPPSEGKTSPARGAALELDSLSFPVLTAPRRRVLDALVDLCRDDPEAAATALGLGPRQLDLVQRNQSLESVPTARAERVYTGVLFDALGLTDLSPTGRRRASRAVAITSALFGLVRPGDRIPAYRLPGDAGLPGVGPVRSVWREALEGAARPALGNGLLVDLRSGTYAAFWRPPGDLASRTASVRVLHEHGGTLKVVSHFNKATKGRLVRALLESEARPRTPEQLADAWRDLGWTVRTGATGAQGTMLDVIVPEL